MVSKSTMSLSGSISSILVSAGGKGEVIGTNSRTTELYLFSPFASVVEFILKFSPTLSVGIVVENP